MRILTVVSRLLDYPGPELWHYRNELIGEIRQARRELPQTADALMRFVRELTARDPMDAQEDYCALFDRGRSLSLLLFEHVHGDSRDRGQAMVDLMDLYNRSGFAITVRELPDYIPLFLEFLASRSRDEIQEWLGDAGHILALLATRLHERQSPYAVLFDVLLEIGHVQADASALRDTVKAEARDDTPDAIDKLWEEEATRFGGQQSGGCGTQKPLPTDSQAAVKWVDGSRMAHSQVATR